MKDKANLLFLANTALSTLCGLALFWAVWMAPADLVSRQAASAALVAAMVAYLLGCGLIMRRREGTLTPLAVAAALPAAATIFGLCMALSKYAGQPIFFACGFIFAVVVGVVALMKNVDELVSPKLLLFAPMTQMMVLHYVIN